MLPCTQCGYVAYDEPTVCIDCGLCCGCGRRFEEVCSKAGRRGWTGADPRTADDQQYYTFVQAMAERLLARRLQRGVAGDARQRRFG